MKHFQIVIVILVLFCFNAFSDDTRQKYLYAKTDKFILENIFIDDSEYLNKWRKCDIYVENGKIVGIENPRSNQIGKKYEAIDCEGKYAIPGLIDCHTHLGVWNTPTNYCLYMWLANGITTIREVSNEYSLDDNTKTKKNIKNGILEGPDILLYPIVLQSDPELVIQKGADGLKTYAQDKKGKPNLAIAYAKSENIRIACHDNGEKNAVELSDEGITSIEHFFGIPESILGMKTGYLEDYSGTYRREELFRKWGKLWTAAMLSSQKNIDTVIKTFINNKTFIVPTLSVYSCLRGVNKQKNEVLSSLYLIKQQRDYYLLDESNGDFGFINRWTLQDEAIWKENIKSWMKFLKCYYDRGGLLAVGADSGFMYNMYGVGYVNELKLLNEAGISTRECINLGTKSSAKLLGIEDVKGSIDIGKDADIIICNKNPYDDLSVLSINNYYSTTATKYGIDLVIKSGVIYPQEYLVERINEIIKENM